MVAESKALNMETLMPVYVVPEDEQLLYMYTEVKHAAATKSASILIRGTRRRKESIIMLCMLKWLTSKSRQLELLRLY